MENVFFHLAIPVRNVEEAKRFYVDQLGCALGRETKDSAIFNFENTQLIAHHVRNMPPRQQGIYPWHFGLAFIDEEAYESFIRDLSERGVPFEQEPRKRHPGTPVEHRTCFLRDPSGNLIELKFYPNESAVFGEQGTSHIGDSRDEEF